MFEDTIKKLQNLNKQWFFVTINKWMFDNEQTILNIAKERMKRGQGVEGGYIGSYAWASYEYFKYTEINPLAGGKVDLFLTGALYRGMRIRPTQQGVYEIISVDNKYDMLSEKYGANQFGLTDKQIEEVKSNAIDDLISKIYKAYE